MSRILALLVAVTLPFLATGGCHPSTRVTQPAEEVSYDVSDSRMTSAAHGDADGSSTRSNESTDATSSQDVGDHTVDDPSHPVDSDGTTGQTDADSVSTEEDSETSDGNQDAEPSDDLLPDDLPETPWRPPESAPPLLICPEAEGFPCGACRVGVVRCDGGEMQCEYNSPGVADCTVDQAQVLGRRLCARTNQGRIACADAADPVVWLRHPLAARAINLRSDGRWLCWQANVGAWRCTDLDDYARTDGLIMPASRLPSVYSPGSRLAPWMIRGLLCSRTIWDTTVCHTLRSDGLTEEVHVLPVTLLGSNDFLCASDAMLNGWLPFACGPVDPGTTVLERLELASAWYRDPTRPRHSIDRRADPAAGASRVCALERRDSTVPWDVQCHHWDGTRFRSEDIGELLAPAGSLQDDMTPVQPPWIHLNASRVCVNERCYPRAPDSVRARLPEEAQIAHVLLDPDDPTLLCMVALNGDASCAFLSE